MNGVSVDFCDKSDILANRFLIEPVVIMVDRVPPSLLLLPGPFSVRAPIPVEPPVIPAKQTTTVGASSSFNKRQASVLNIGPLYTN